MIANLRLNGAVWDAGQLANILLLAVLVVGATAKRTSVQGSAAVLFLAVLTWANVFVWSQIAL